MATKTTEPIDRQFASARKGKKEVAKKARALKRLQVVYVPLDSVKPNAYNPNRQSDHDFNLLIRSMQEDGFTQPVVCIRITAEHQSDPKFKGYGLGDLVIVDGEHRWRAARKLGLPELPVVITDMTVEQMRIATLRHNRARGSEDIELSADVLRDLRELGALEWAQDSLLIDDVELNRLLDDVPAPEVLAAEEFSTAWEAAEKTDRTDDDKQEADSTVQAADRVRERERLIKAAKSEGERRQIRKETDVFRLSLVYTNDEAAEVRRVLGQQPAVRLLEICREYAAANPGKTLRNKPRRRK